LLAAGLLAASVGCGRQAKPPAPPSGAATEAPAATTSPQTATPRKPPPHAEPTGRQEGRITSYDQLAAVLKERNPGFAGEVAMEPISPELLALEIHDAQLKDIRPLARQRIGKLDLSRCDLTDLSPLEGMPLVELYLEDNRHLADISALRGMPLQKLYLSHTGVQNLGPLRGSPLDELNLVGTRVRDVGPLSDSPIRMLWLNDCPVENITPLGKLPLESLTLENAPVRDISPLAGNRLQRLHIGGTQVTDLTPLKQLRLVRLIFTPGRIKTGLDVARQMAGLREIGTTLDGRMAPSEFWPLVDKGEIK
jgi:hypothetical protein